MWVGTPTTQEVTAEGIIRAHSSCRVSLCRDGTSSIVLLIGELMKQSERYLQEGSHPRVIVEVSGRQQTCVQGVRRQRNCSCACVATAGQPSGLPNMLAGTCLCASHAQGFDVAKKALLEFLDKFKTDVDPADREVRRGGVPCVPRDAVHASSGRQQPASAREQWSCGQTVAACQVCTVGRPVKPAVSACLRPCVSCLSCACRLLLAPAPAAPAALSCTRCSCCAV